MSTGAAMAGAQASEMIEVRGVHTEIYRLGQGEPLLLLHGGWAGPSAHWRAVWPRLSENYRVIVPELPGVVSGTPFDSYADYSAWLRELILTLGIGPVNCVGNSFGGILGWCLAAQFPEAVRMLILVDGGLVPRDPVTRMLLPLPGGVHVLTRLAQYNNFSRFTLPRAFAKPSRAPAEIVEALTRPRRSQIDGMLKLFLRGAPDIGIPRVPVRILWGRQDRLIGWTVRTGKQIARRIPGATLHVIEDAGHLPQVEQPEQFVRVLRSVLVPRIS